MIWCRLLMVERVLSYVLEALGVLVLAAVIWGLTGSVWWALIPVAAYLVFVSYNLGGKR